MLTVTRAHPAPPRRQIRKSREKKALPAKGWVTGSRKEPESILGQYLVLITPLGEKGWRAATVTND